jgi:hypothetical protein
LGTSGIYWFIPRFIAIAWIADRSFIEPSCGTRIITTGHKRVISASPPAYGTTSSAPRLKINSLVLPPLGGPEAKFQRLSFAGLGGGFVLFQTKFAIDGKQVPLKHQRLPAED